MGESSVLMALLSLHPLLAFLSPQRETLAELHPGSLEPLSVEQEVCLWQKQELAPQGGFPLTHGGLNF